MTPVDVASLKGPPPRRHLVRLDVATKNPLNNSQGRTRAGMLWRARERRKLRQMTAMQCGLQLGLLTPWTMPLIRRVDREAGSLNVAIVPVKRITITLVRISPLPLDHWDGLRAALKPVVDGVADFLGVKDSDKRVMWNYNQTKGRVREHAVEITFEREPQ